MVMGSGWWHDEWVKGGVKDGERGVRGETEGKGSWKVF